MQPLEPHLELVVTPTTGNTGDSFKFQAQAVSFIGSSQDQLLVRWDFDGDGNFDTEFKNPKEVTHVYNQAGLYTPVVELKDLDGSTSRRSGYTVYNGNYPDRRQLGRVLVNRGAELNLNAAFTVSPTGGSVQTQFYFDASASISGRGGLMYRWDFEGDGNFDTPWQNEAKASHIYSYDGEKSVILQIKDKNGAIVRAVRKIAIDQLNVRPQVDFNVQVLGLALNRKAPVITSGSEVRFIPILREYDDTVANLELRWDFDGDGNFDTDFSKQRLVSYRYLNAGTYQAKLQVRDQDADISERIKPVTIIANQAPQAMFTVSPQKGTIGTEFVFNATGVSDAETMSGQLKLRWDFDNDGVFETDFSGRKIERHTYSSVGQQLALLQVIDRQGSMATAELMVEVVENTAPRAAMVINPTEGLLTTTFQLDASASLDREVSDSRQLLYRWNFGDGTKTPAVSQFTARPKASVRYETTGVKTVTLEVKDPDGQISSISQEITIHWAAAYLEAARKAGVGLLGSNSSQMKALSEPINRLGFLRLALLTEAGRQRRGLAAKQQALAGIELPFTDVKQLAATDKALLAEALQRGIISPNSYFNPTATLTRAEALKMIFKVNTLAPATEGATAFKDVNPSSWPAPYIKQAEALGLVRGYEDNSFRPFNPVRADEALKLVFEGQKA